MNSGISTTAELRVIRAQVEARAKEDLRFGVDTPSEKDPVTSAFVSQCLDCNELGDGLLFAAINKGKFVFEATAAQWLVWTGHTWEIDITGKVLGAVETIATRYVSEETVISRQLAASADEGLTASLGVQQRRYARRIDKLRSVRGRLNCLAFAASLPESAMVVTGEKLDADPWLLACRNGVIHLKTGHCRPGHPDDFITKAAPVEWTGFDTPAPAWEKFLLEIMDGDQEMVDYLRRLFGYAVSGSVREHAFVVFHGNGRNGKGTLIETLQRVLGPLAKPIPPEMLLDQGRVRNSAGPSPDIMSLRGLRLAFAGETDQGRRFSAAPVKRLSGGDSLTGRNPHDRAQITFEPSHLLILATNFRPKANADDPAFWARMHLVDFPLSFVERPSAENERLIDRTLDEKLLAESSGILAWLVRGCLEWQQSGLRPPKKILEAIALYRRSEDDLADWMDEKCLIVDGSTVTAKAAYSSFKEWFTATISDKPPSQKRWGESMTRRFEKEKGGGDNTVRYLGLELRNPL
jgi:putative DNA primase/helicase